VTQQRETDLRTAEQPAAALREIDPAELARVGGGYDEGNWCGTHYPGWHPTPIPMPKPVLM
jgi:hypothetical protein